MLKKGVAAGSPADVWSLGCIAVCIILATEHPYIKVPPRAHMDTAALTAAELEPHICEGRIRPTVKGFEGIVEYMSFSW